MSKPRSDSAIWALTVVVAAGCVPASRTEVTARAPTAELYEFANMRESNLVPKSSSAALVKAFEKFCFDSGRDAKAVAKKLRAADFVAAPNTSANGQTAFVVGDTRPMVVISDDGRFCAVVAQSRTGQTARIRSMIDRRFPGTRHVRSDTPKTEILVQTSGRNGGLVTLRRLAPTIAGSRVVLAMQRAS